MKPLPSCATDLPSTIALVDSPQLAHLAVLQVSLRVTAASLDLHHPGLGSLPDTILDPDGWPPSILAQLIVDRCRELSELIAGYRISLTLPRAEDPSPADFFPF